MEGDKNGDCSQQTQLFIFKRFSGEFGFSDDWYVGRKWFPHGIVNTTMVLGSHPSLSPLWRFLSATLHYMGLIFVRWLNFALFLLVWIEEDAYFRLVFSNSRPDLWPSVPWCIGWKELLMSSAMDVIPENEDHQVQKDATPTTQQNNFDVVDGSRFDVLGSERMEEDYYGFENEAEALEGSVSLNTANLASEDSDDMVVVDFNGERVFCARGVFSEDTNVEKTHDNGSVSGLRIIVQQAENVKAKLIDATPKIDEGRDYLSLVVTPPRDVDTEKISSMDHIAITYLNIMDPNAINTADVVVQDEPMEAINKRKREDADDTVSPRQVKGKTDDEGNGEGVGTGEGVCGSVDPNPPDFT